MSETIQRLELLNDEELKHVLKHIETNKLLDPIKQNPKTYSLQAKKLGTMNSKSALLIQNLLPGMVFTLIKRKDQNYVALINSELREQCREFNQFIETYREDNVLEHSVAESYANLYWEYKNIQNSLLDEQLFWILLKLCDDTFTLDEYNHIQFSISVQADLRKLSAEKDAIIENLRHEKKSEINQLKSSHAKEVKELNQEISRLTNIIQKDKDKLEQQWMDKVKENYRNKLEVLELMYSERNNELEQSFQKKNDELIARDSEMQLTLEAEYNEKRNQYEAAINELDCQKENLKKEKDNLEDQVHALNIKKEELDDYIEQYFNSFETHAVQLRIDNLLESRFAKLGMDTISIAEPMTGEKIPNNQIFVYGGNELAISEEFDPAENLQDMVMDFGDNIAVHFSHSFEIASIFLAAYFSGKSLLIDAASAKEFSDCISALIDSKTAAIVDVNDGKYSLHDIVTEIKSRDGHVFVIDGLIDRYDDKLIPGIVNAVKEKFVIFTYPTTQVLRNISSKCLMKSIVLNLEEYLEFEDNENLLIGHYSPLQFKPNVSAIELKTYYKNFFMNLYESEMITNGLAKEMTIYLGYYFKISKNTTLSSCVKETIKNAMKYDAESDEVKQLLDASNLL